MCVWMLKTIWTGVKQLSTFSFVTCTKDGRLAFKRIPKRVYVARVEILNTIFTLQAIIQFIDTLTKHLIYCTSRILMLIHLLASLLILFTIQSYQSYYIGVTANSLYLSFSPCKATITNHMVSPQTVFTYHFHHAKLPILLHGVTTNSLYLSFSPSGAPRVWFLFWREAQFFF